MPIRRFSITSFTFEDINTPLIADIEPELGLRSQTEQPYVYYQPGCYSSSQVVQHSPQAVPFCTTYMQDYLPHWNLCRSASYVADAIGMVYYVSEFDNQQLLPNALQSEMTLLDTETEIAYHFPNKVIDEVEGDTDSHFVRQSPYPHKKNVIHKHKSGAGHTGPLPSNVYRSEEGYLVEEPESEDDESQSHK